MKILEKFDQWLFSIIGPAEFIFLAIFLAAFGDATYLVFIKFVLGSEANLRSWMQDYRWIPNMELILRNPELMSQMKNNFNYMLNILIGGVIFINLIGYFYFIKRKKFAIKYMRNLALTGFILGIFSIFEARAHGTLWVVLMAILIPAYFVIYRGMKYHDYN